MKEYNSKNLNLYNMDRMELLRQTPYNYYDLCICDTPYGIDVTKMNMGGRKRNENSIIRLGELNVK